MPTPQPSNITAQPKGGNWVVVSWDPVSGADYYECQHQGESHTSRLSRPESALLDIATGTTRYTKIRNVVDEQPSGWVTVTLNHHGEIVDIDYGDEQPPPEQPPAPPSGLRLASTDPEYASATVSWNNQPDADYWDILLENVFPRERKANSPEYTFSDLVAGETYGWRVRAVRKGTSGKLLRSGWVRSEFTFDDEKPPPPPPGPVPTPTGVHTHCTTDRSTKVEWADDPDVDGWEVHVGDRFGAVFTASPLVTITGLEPNTGYTVSVIARVGDPGQPDYRESDPATHRFTTLSDEPKPPPPPPDIGADYSAPSGLFVQATGPSTVKATWSGDRPVDEHGQPAQASPYWYATADGRRWYRVDTPECEFTGLQAGQQYRVAVHGVWGMKLTGIASKATKAEVRR